jgi:transcriptional regulator with XRE-family HTH domain
MTRKASLAIRERLASNLKSVRQARGYTQEGVGKRCGLHKLRQRRRAGNSQHHAREPGSTSQGYWLQRFPTISVTAPFGHEAIQR